MSENKENICPVRLIRLCPIYGRTYKINRFGGPVLSEMKCQYEGEDRETDCEIYREMQEGVIKLFERR